MWFQRVSSFLVVFGFIILILVAGALFLTVGPPFLSFGSAFLVICGAIFIFILGAWPVIGAVVSWKSMGLYHQPEKKFHYKGLGLLCIIYGLGILGFLDRYSPLGEWIVLGNSLGIILRSVFYEWRVAQGRVCRLSINLLVAIILPLTVKIFLLYH